MRTFNFQYPFNPAASSIFYPVNTCTWAAFISAWFYPSKSGKVYLSRSDYAISFLENSDTDNLDPRGVKTSGGAKPFAPEHPPSFNFSFEYIICSNPSQLKWNYSDCSGSRRTSGGNASGSFRSSNCKFWLCAEVAVVDWNCHPVPCPFTSL